MTYYMEKSSSWNFQSSLILKLLIFVIGLSIGMTSSVYYQSFRIFLQTSVSSSSTQLFASLSPAPPPPPPLLASSPLPLLLQPPPPPANESLLVHEMDDEESFARAVAPNPLPPKSVPKVAFLFLCRGHIPLAPLWEVFFKGNEGLYSIYVHPHPSHVDSFPPNSVFYKRRIPSNAVGWGEASVTDAERRLLASALLDPSNQRFVLQSESGIPLFNFTTIYNYLINSPKSFTDSFDLPTVSARGRYNPGMFPEITVAQWRKGSQWFEVNRKIALLIVSDTKYYSVFLQRCKPPCFVLDEHYIPTLINIICPEDNMNRSVTWTDWSRGGMHPRTFGPNDISEEFIDRMRFGANCTYNGNTTNFCFLFARKFHKNTLQPLLQLLPKLFFNNSVSL